MADFRTDLVNELRNQKYYLEQDLVRLVNNPIDGYKVRLEEIKECMVEIGKCNTALALTDVYLPSEEQQKAAAAQQQSAPAPESTPEQADDVVSGDAQPAPTPQPIPGQTHGE